MLGMVIVALWYGITIGLSYYFAFGDRVRLFFVLGGPASAHAAPCRRSA